MIVHDARLVVLPPSGDGGAPELLMALVDDAAAVRRQYWQAGVDDGGIEEFADGSRAVTFRLGGGRQLTVVQGDTACHAYVEVVRRVAASGAQRVTR